jgi:hypothetical protein
VLSPLQTSALEAPYPVCSNQAHQCGVTILFNLFFFLGCPWLQTLFPDAFSWFDISRGVDYVLISNLTASVINS